MWIWTGKAVRGPATLGGRYRRTSPRPNNRQYWCVKAGGCPDDCAL